MPHAPACGTESSTIRCAGKHTQTSSAIVGHRGMGHLLRNGLHVELEPGVSGSGLALKPVQDSSEAAHAGHAASCLASIVRLTLPHDDHPAATTRASVTGTGVLGDDDALVQAVSGLRAPRRVLGARSAFFFRPRGRGHALAQANLLDRSCFGSCTLSHLGVDVVCPTCIYMYGWRVGGQPSSCSSWASWPRSVDGARGRGGSLWGVTAWWAGVDAPLRGGGG